MGTSRQRGSKHTLPESAYTIRDYKTLKEIAQGFAQGKIKLLILLGGPGKGKGQTIKRAMVAEQPTTNEEFMQVLDKSLANILQTLAPDQQPDPTPVKIGPGLYIKGFMKPIVFHIKVYQHRGSPITVDDADIFFGHMQLRECIKYLTETDTWKLQAYNSLATELKAQGVPNEFYTNSPVCIIKNVWDSNDHVSEAIESRATIIVFDPTWDETYKYIGEWFWDQEIYDYLLQQMPLLQSPDCRIVTKAYDLKTAAVAGLDWRTAIDTHIMEPSHKLVVEYLNKPFPTEKARWQAWCEATGESRPTWYRKVDEVKGLGAARPARIILTHTAPPIETRPPDSPLS